MKSQKELTLKHRNCIKKLLTTTDKTVKEIAEFLGFTPNALRYEINENGGKSNYDPKKAHLLVKTANSRRSLGVKNFHVKNPDAKRNTMHQQEKRLEGAEKIMEKIKKSLIKKGLMNAKD